jgi:raffinose/stachyose/melibiose transport system permease protein
MKRLWIYGIFLLPALLVFTLFLMYPVVSSFYYSLTDWNGVALTPTFIGFDNFRELWADQDVWDSLSNTFHIAILLMLATNVLGLILAYCLQGIHLVYRWLRVWFMIPLLISPLAISYVWNYIYSPVDGILNTLLKSAGLNFLVHDWLGDSHLAIYSVIFSSVWQSVALSMIIYVAGLQSIPRDLYEAAEIDGAGSFRRFVSITFPLIAPAFTVNMVVTMIFGLKFFDMIFIMTGGGPGGATQNLAILLYRQAFTFNRMGYGSAIAIIMFLIILLISFLQVIMLRKREVEY